jgi:hypothetical protein
MNGDNQQKPDEHQSQPDAGQWEYKPAQQPSAPNTPNTSLAPSAGLGLGPAPPPLTRSQDISWTASEFVAHNKGFNWYALLVLAAIAFAMVIWLLTRDFISVAVIVIVAILLGVAATRKPRVLEYHLDNEGLEIAGKFYPYVEFRSFSIMQEGAFSSIMLIPMRRFAPPISIYYSPDDEEEIVNVISMHLPHEERGRDMADRIAKRIRF